MQLHRLGQPAPSGPNAAVLPSGQHPCHESRHLTTWIPWTVSGKKKNKWNNEMNKFVKYENFTR